MVQISSSRQRALLRKYARNIKFFMIVVSVCLIVFALPKQAQFRYEFEKGRIWNQKDLVSPYNFAILKTQDEIAADRKAALATITPIYRVDEDNTKQQIEGFRNDLEIKWHTSGINDKLKPAYITAGNNLLNYIYTRGVIKINPKHQRPSENFSISILNNNIATEKNIIDLFTKETALNYCEQTLSNRKDVDKAFLLDLLDDRLQTNLNYDEKLTNKLEKEIVENLSTTRGMVQTGDVIVAKGSVVSDEVFQKLQSYKKAFEDNARVNGDGRLVLLGRFLLVGLAITLLMVFLYLFRRDIYNDNRLVGLILLVVTTMLATLSLAIFLQIPNLYYIPYC
ncbi:MAG: transmembrane HD family protein, partial [Sphingobacteriaceae bacterium]